ncbi:MAG: DUF1351 domain-containing protein [Desulfovibrio sp.]|jgi:hypothetical protein|nr:DUF1351 domain-containing protein [Desulfovibrio sp.]
MESMQETLPALRFTPPVISLDFEGLEARVRGITEQYAGLHVQESDVPAIKSEMAGLNKLKDMLAVARKEAVERISAPIREFENHVKSLESEILSTRTMLDEQVKTYVQAEREGRRAVVQCMIDAAKDDLKCPDIEIPIQESWLNKTAKDKTTAAEIRAIIIAHQKEAMEKAALEQSRKDRLLGIERHVAALNAQYQMKMPVSRFLTDGNLDLEISFDDVCVAIQRVYNKEAAEEAERKRLFREAETRAKDNPPQPATAPQQENAPPPAAVPEAPQPATALRKKRMVVQATYLAENGEEIGKLYRLIKGLCLECRAQVSDINEVPF